MTFDKWLSSERDIREWIREDKREWDLFITRLGKVFDETKILTSGFFGRTYYSLKHNLFNRISNDYRNVEGYEGYIQ